MATNFPPFTPAASVRYDLFKEFPPETPSPPTSPEREEKGIDSLSSGDSVRDLSSLIRRSVRHATSINPLHFQEASSLKSPSREPGQPNRSVSDIYRDSVKCMNEIIKVALPKNKELAQALFDEAEKVQKLLPQHRDKVRAALQA